MQQGQKLVGNGIIGKSFQGNSVSISNGNSVIVGGLGDNNNTGAVWVFTRTGGVWTQLGSKLIGTGAVGNSRQGFSVAISSEGTVIEGGPYDNGSYGAAWIFYNPALGITPISNEVPKSFSLSQNYPNPFNPSTVIKFEVASYRFIKLSVYDVPGKEISTLVNEQLQPGSYEVNWNASNFPSGVYFYKLAAGDFVETKKMILMK